MAKKFYVVWKGRETGVYSDWDSCRNQVYGFPGARYKSFPSRDAAEAAFREGKAPAAARATTAASGKRSGSKSKTWSGAEVDALDVEFKLFTDGGCEPNPGEAGSGVALYQQDVVTELWYGLYHPEGTNNTAELNALNEALRMAQALLQEQRTLAIFCDSRYAISCITEWASGWQARGWTRKTGEIRNVDLIKPMYERYLPMAAQLQIFHVNGHVGVEGNELADRMSLMAIARRETEFVRYEAPIDVAEILSRRSG